jgi:hypothetical protein
LSTHHYIDVLRYWVAAIRHEESLTTRPKAIRVSGPAVFDWQRPVGNHSYFKVPRPVSFEELLLDRRREAVLTVGPEQRSFLARQARQVYYRQDHAWQTDETTRSTVVVGFPSIYFPRSDELATLIRLRVTVEWFDDSGKPLSLPTKKERDRKAFPGSPTTYMLKKILEEDESILPLSIDSRVLTQDLGFPEEVVLDFTNALSAYEGVSASQIFAALIQLITTGDWSEDSKIPDSDPDPEHEPLPELLKVIRKRLMGEGRNATAYDVGLVYDGAQSFTTHHLRRDLSLIISGRLRRALVQDGPLRAYLSQQASPPDLRPLIGQSAPDGLSISQRAVAEQFLGSVFTAAQGPPGTGKTRLISDLAAHVLVQRMHTLATSEELEGPSLLVTSTNNRAVDQVLATLQADLPWGLRAGSQQVTETATVATIDRLLAWLDQYADHPVEWAAEKAAYLEVYEAAESEGAPHVAYRQYRSQQCAIDHEMQTLAALQTPDLFGRETVLLEVDLLKIDDVLDRMTLLKQRFKAIARILVPGGQRAFESAASAWTKLKRGPWKDGLAAFDACGLSLVQSPIDKPEKDADVETICQTWSSGVESVVDDLDDLYGVVESVRNYRKRIGKSERVKQHADLLAADPVLPTEPSAMNQAQHALFNAAQRLRKAWLCHQRLEVVDILIRLRETALEFRSLRRFFQESRRDVELIQTIFPVMGSTLLSVANVIGTESDVMSHVVIDEGGQCHPAYAVSALMRAKHALIVGDVFQLQPVFSLSLEDEKRVQKASRVNLKSTESSIFRVYEGCGNSAQSIADSAFDVPVKLTDHYRSNEHLIGLCDELCGYELTVHTDHEMLTNRCASLSSSLLITPVQGQQIRTRGSWSNEAEVEQVVSWLFYLFEHGIHCDQIAVLTPYVGQLDAIRSTLHRRGITTLDQPGLYIGEDDRLPIGTVHRFQGGERDIILYSSVVTTPRSLQFQNQRVNLINVAVSRARKHFITIGDAGVIAQGRYTGYLVERSEVVEMEAIRHA